jgi:hypothetical protein
VAVTAIVPDAIDLDDEDVSERAPGTSPLDQAMKDLSRGETPPPAPSTAPPTPTPTTTATATAPAPAPAPDDAGRGAP